jgi:short-subunit dehydrogenase
VSEELQAKYKVQVKTVPADLCSASAKTWDDIALVVAALPVGVLVNSAGMSYDHAEYFDLVDDKQIADLIAINVSAVTKVYPVYSNVH